MLGKVFNFGRTYINRNNIKLFEYQSRYIESITVGNILNIKDNKSPKDLICCHLEDNLNDAAKKMEKHNIGSLIIEDDNDNTVGILTSRDLQKVIANYDSKIIDDLKCMFVIIFL